MILEIGFPIIFGPSYLGLDMAVWGGLAHPVPIIEMGDGGSELQVGPGDWRWGVARRWGIGLTCGMGDWRWAGPWLPGEIGDWRWGLPMLVAGGGRWAGGREQGGICSNYMLTQPTLKASSYIMSSRSSG